MKNFVFHIFLFYIQINIFHRSKIYLNFNFPFLLLFYGLCTVRLLIIKIICVKVVGLVLLVFNLDIHTFSFMVSGRYIF